MLKEYYCVCHGDKWADENNMMDHQVQYFSSESRRHESNSKNFELDAKKYEKLYYDLKLQLELRRHSINEMYRRGMEVVEKEMWLEHKEKEQEEKHLERQAWYEEKERELEMKDAELKVRESHTRHLRRRLHVRTMEVEDRERRFPVDE